MTIAEWCFVMHYCIFVYIIEIVKLVCNYDKINITRQVTQNGKNYMHKRTTNSMSCCESTLLSAHLSTVVKIIGTVTCCLLK
jgi:hypothetical protein